MYNIYILSLIHILKYCILLNIISAFELLVSLSNKVSNSSNAEIIFNNIQYFMQDNQGIDINGCEHGINGWELIEMCIRDRLI